MSEVQLPRSRGEVHQQYVELIEARAKVERLREALEYLRLQLEDWTMGRCRYSIQQLEAQTRACLNGMPMPTK